MSIYTKYRMYRRYSPLEPSKRLVFKYYISRSVLTETSVFSRHQFYFFGYFLQADPDKFCQYDLLLLRDVNAGNTFPTQTF